MCKSHFFFLLFIYACSTIDEKKLKSEIFVLSEKIQQDPDNINLLLERIAFNKEKGHLESMLYDYKQIILLDSLNFNFHFNIAEIYFELSKAKRCKSSVP